MRFNPIPTVLLLVAMSLGAAAAPPESPVPTGLLQVHKIWDAAPHNAFTDLIRFQDRWVCAFREGDSHLGKTADGHIRVIESNDTETWNSAVMLTDPRGDIRDAKLSIAPDGRLVLLTAIHLRAAGANHPAYQSIAFLTRDLKKWEGPLDVGEPDMWLWGLKWHNGAGYSVGYATHNIGRFVTIYKTTDGAHFESIAKLDLPSASPTETALAFDDAGVATMLLRSDPDAAYIGQAKPPYTDWQLKKTSQPIGGPALTYTPDGRLLGGGRLHPGKVHMALFWVDPTKPELTEWLRLPSGGDCSYPGFVWRNGVLNVSYYSSHEGKTSIYFATVRVPEAQK
jgi:hypothetical protein